MASSYDRARRQQVDPNKVRWAGHKVNSRAVDEYRRNPNKRSTDGDPFIVVGKDGVARGWNGKHRGRAAQLEGRKLTARVHDERTAGPAQAAGCMGLMLCAAVLVGLVRRLR
jgi:hypothetical protein